MRLPARARRARATTATAVVARAGAVAVGAAAAGPSTTGRVPAAAVARGDQTLTMGSTLRELPGS
jgi:hypothetical protein